MDGRRTPPARIRLDKYLADMGMGSRQKVKQGIRKGWVTVGGNVVKSPDYKVDVSSECVEWNGTAVRYKAYEYYMLNKPAGTVSATEDARDTTVVELIASRSRKDLFPVGRLDKDTEGLLLITNDGALAHRLLAPGKHVDKTYYARVQGRAVQADTEAFAAGLNIGTQENPEWTRPAGLEIIEAGDQSLVRVTIQEGKYHQVKRMFQAVGKEVLYLRRESMGSLLLDPNLLPGEYRLLTDKELEEL